MQEIAPHVFIEKNSLGLMIGLISTEKGSVLIDSPLRQDDLSAWRNNEPMIKICDPRFLIILDINYDRLLSAKGSDCIVIAQANSVMPVKAKPTSTKTTDEQTDSSESYESPASSARPILPDFIFQEDFGIFLGNMELRLEHHRGANIAGSWVELPKEKVLFVGDTVMGDQPPFLAYFNADAWLADLELLSADSFKEYQIVSSRAGLVNPEQVLEMKQVVNKIKTLLDPLMQSNASLDEILKLIPIILEDYHVDAVRRDLYYNRLRWGLSTYYELNHN